MRPTWRGSCPINCLDILRITPVRPGIERPSPNSDQPTKPASVVIFRNESVRQPALACISSTTVIFIASPLSSQHRTVRSVLINERKARATYYSRSHEKIRTQYFNGIAQTFPELTVNIVANVADADPYLASAEIIVTHGPHLE